MSGMPSLVAGRYALFEEIAAGGMATVHLGRMVGAKGFSRIVAVKRLRPIHARSPEFAAMFLDEARLASRIRHPNVVTLLDVVDEGGEVLLVLEYIHGESLSSLARTLQAAGERTPVEVALSAMTGALHGLHAAHEARSEDGQPLGIVHRDVSPQNILVGVDGVARVLDFGIAKANIRSVATEEGQLKGKLVFMAPEQLAGEDVSRASDVYAAGVVLWELLAGRRLHDRPTQGGVVAAILEGRTTPLLDAAPWVPPKVAAVVDTALARAPSERWATAQDMALALERAAPHAAPHEVGAWVSAVGAASLAGRRQQVQAIETGGGATGETAPSTLPVLDPSERSVTRTTTARDTRPRRSSRWSAWVAVALGGLAVTATAWFFGPGRSAAPSGEGARLEQARTSASLERTAAPTLAPSPVPRPQAEDPAEDPADPAEPAAAITTGSTAAPTREASPPARPAPPKPPREAPRAPPSASPTSAPASSSGSRPSLPACDPPWEVDAQGIRRVKRACIVP